MIFREIDDALRRLFRNTSRQRACIGLPRCDPCRLINGILYVLMTGCTWLDIPAKYSTKINGSPVHLELCEKGVCMIFSSTCSDLDTKSKKLMSPIVRRIPRTPRRKMYRPAMMAIKGKGNRLSALVDRAVSLPARLHRQISTVKTNLSYIRDQP